MVYGLGFRVVGLLKNVYSRTLAVYSYADSSLVWLHAQVAKVSEDADIAVLKGAYQPPKFLLADADIPGATVFFTGHS